MCEVRAGILEDLMRMSRSVGLNEMYCDRWIELGSPCRILFMYLLVSESRRVIACGVSKQLYCGRWSYPRQYRIAI